MKTDHFQRVLARVRDAYEQSDIKRYCEQNRLEWFYSVSATQLVPGRPVIIGFNWGATQGQKYRPQELCPSDRFLDLINKGWLGSMARIAPSLSQYMGPDILESIGQFNYCFFRSSSENEISRRDLELCRPIFLELFDVIRPSHALCFSAHLRNYWKRAGALMSERTKVVPFMKSNGPSSYKAYSARLRNTDTEVHFLPHPNYAITSEAREEIWRFAFNRA